MTRRLVLSYLAIVAVVLAVLEIPLGINYARSQRDALVTNLERDAVVVAGLVEDQLQGGIRPVRTDLTDYVDGTAGIRVVVTDGDGISVLDSSGGFPIGRDYSTRGELATALGGGRASGTRWSETLAQNLVYVAVPVASGGTVHGAVRITYPRAAVDARIRRNWWLLAGVAGSVLTTTLVVGVALSRWITAPTRALGAVVAAVASGQLDQRARADLGPPEIRDLARRFNAMAERLGELIQSQRSFVADASHQLRSPLTALRLELEDLGDTDDGNTRSGLDRAVDETRRLGRLLDGLLVLARADGVRPEPTRIDVSQVLAGRLRAWQPVADDAGVELAAAQDVVHTPICAMAVDGHLEQTLDNLIANALEATPAGGQVVIGVDTHPDHLTVDLVDTGAGMTDDELGRAFDRFWRAGDARPGEGSGLGLPIARQLVRAGGGDLVLDRAPGGGTRARITLPRPQD